jgi:Leucine-rich repeat (LRR) protein
VRCHGPYGGLSGKKLLESDFSMRFNGIGCLSSLEYLTLSRNNFATLPASISQLSKLETLDLSYCYKLQSLPVLPSTVRYINAQCYSLEQPSPALRRVYLGSGILRSAAV